MFYRHRDRFNRWRFARACAGILRTPPLRLDARSSTLLFTQLQHKDVLLALVALKSFAQRVPVGGIRILDDGSLSDADRALLAAHLPGVQFLELAAVRTPACPRGGCWERLLWIAKLSQTHYVVQLDSDTVAADALPEVDAAIAQGRSFVIGTWDDQVIEPMSERRAEAARHLAAQTGTPHVQLVAEAHFDRLDDCDRLRYVRGCAGFAGFARGAVDVGFIEAVSQQMAAALGATWQQWGSEQVMSNIVVANDPNAVVLPHPKYCDCTRAHEGTAFVHFIGSCRFRGSLYRRLARRAIAAL